MGGAARRVHSLRPRRPTRGDAPAFAAWTRGLPSTPKLPSSAPSLSYIALSSPPKISGRSVFREIVARACPCRPLNSCELAPVGFSSGSRAGLRGCAGGQGARSPATAAEEDAREQAGAEQVLGRAREVDDVEESTAKHRVVRGGFQEAR